MHPGGSPERRGSASQTLLILKAQPMPLLPGSLPGSSCHGPRSASTFTARGQSRPSARSWSCPAGALVSLVAVNVLLMAGRLHHLPAGSLPSTLARWTLSTKGAGTGLCSARSEAWLMAQRTVVAREMCAQ